MKRVSLRAIAGVLTLAGLGLFAPSADAQHRYQAPQPYYPQPYDAYRNIGYQAPYQTPYLYPPVTTAYQSRDGVCIDYRLTPQIYYTAPSPGVAFPPQPIIYGHQNQGSYYPPQTAPYAYQTQGSYYLPQNVPYGYQNQGSYYPPTVIIRR